MVLTGLLGRSLRSRVRLTPGFPLVARRALRVAELVLRALWFAVEVVGPVVTTAYDIWSDSSPALLQDCQRKQGRDFRSTTKQRDDFALENPAVLYLPKVATRSGVEGRSPQRIFGGLLLLLPISTPTCS